MAQGLRFLLQRRHLSVVGSPRGRQLLPQRAKLFQCACQLALQPRNVRHPCLCCCTRALCCALHRCRLCKPSSQAALPVGCCSLVSARRRL